MVLIVEHTGAGLCAAKLAKAWNIVAQAPQKKQNKLEDRWFVPLKRGIGLFFFLPEE